MAKLKTKALENDAVTGAKFKLANAENLRARNAANDGDVNLFNLSASNILVFQTQPTFGSDPVNANDLTRRSWVVTQLGNYILSSEKGANNGVATLDGGGKIPVGQLPSAVMTYEGLWDASTNDPALTDGTGDAGMVYLVSVAGTVDFGSGNITFAIGDWAVYNGSIWQKSLNSNAVVSVNGNTGVVVLDSDDIDEGSTNLYFTDARAKSAAVDDTAYDATSWNGVTDVAPSKNAVRDEIEAIYADIAALTGSINGKETLTLDATDISNGYVDLAQEIINNSLHVVPVGWIPQEAGVDYTLSVEGGVTRVTFANDLLDLADGDKVVFQYEY